MGDLDEIARIRVQITVEIADAKGHDREKRVFKLFDPEDFLVPPVPGCLIWPKDANLSAVINNVVVVPEVPQVAISCLANRPINKVTFHRLIASGWVQMPSKGETVRWRKEGETKMRAP
jgi:hypothetical protein